MRAITKSFIIAVIAATAMGANAQSSRTLTREQVIDAVTQVYVHEKACGSKTSDSAIKWVQSLAANNGVNLNDISAQNDINRIVDVNTTFATRLTPELHKRFCESLIEVIRMAQEAKQTEREGSNETRKQQQQSAAPTASTPTNGSREVVHEPRQFPVRDVEKVCRDMWHAQMAINVCIDAEQSYYNTARAF